MTTGIIGLRFSLDPLEFLLLAVWLTELRQRLKEVKEPANATLDSLSSNWPQPVSESEQPKYGRVSLKSKAVDRYH